MYTLWVLLVQVRRWLLATAKVPYRQWQPVGEMWMIGEIHNPVMKVMLEQDDASQKVVGSNPGAGKDFSRGISVNVNLNILLKNLYISMREITRYLICLVYICGRYTPNSNKKVLF